MEKAENVYVLCADFGWSDLGTWGSLYENGAQDEGNNVTFNSNVLLYNSQNNIVKSNSEKLIVIEGLNDYIVVETEKALLICSKKNEQELRQIVNDIKIKKKNKYI